MSLSEKESLRQALPDKAQPLFDDIVIPRVLGASTHIERICQILELVGTQESSQSGLDFIDRLLDYFCETRGKSSYAIVNASHELKASIQAQLQGRAEISTAVKAAVSQFHTAKQLHQQRIVKYATTLLQNCRKVLIYDYSSTVEAVVEKLDPEVAVVIAESRTINGGIPFVESCVRTHSHVSFIPDAALCQGLAGCDAVLIGAETFYPDGTAFNTVGSDITALLAHYEHIPYYVLTPIQKADLRPLTGSGKTIQPKNLQTKLAEGIREEDAEHMDFWVKECVPIAPNLIAAYVTELGVLPPCALFSALLTWKSEYFQDQGGAV